MFYFVGMLETFDFPWVRFLAMRITHIADGTCTAVLDPQDVHLNHNETVNGPVLFGAAEYAAGAAVTGGMMDLLHNAYVVAKTAQIDFLAPARGPVTCAATVDAEAFTQARSKVEQQQPVELTAQVTATDGQGRQVATVRLIFAVRPKRQA